MQNDVLTQGFDTPINKIVNVDQMLNRTPQRTARGGRNFAPGLAGNIEKFLPTIGGIGGGALGFLAGGVGAPIGGAAGSMAGQKLEDLLTGGHASTGTYLEQGALGGLTGIGKGALAAKAGVDALRGGEGAGAALSALRGGTGSAVGSVASSAGQTTTGAAGNFATRFGNSMLATGAQGMGMTGIGAHLLDVLPPTTAKMADYGFARPSQWEGIANKVTGDNGVLNTVKNSILGRAEKNGATVNLEGWHPTLLANPRTGQYSGAFTGVKYDPLLASDNTVHNAIVNNALDPNAAQSVWQKTRAMSQNMSEAGNTPTATFDAIKNLEAAGRKAYSAGKTDLGGTYRDISTNLKDRLDQAVQHEVVTPQDVSTMIQGLKDNGVTNPNILREIQGLAGGPALGIRGIEKTFVDASQIGAATRRATEIQKGALISRTGGLLGLGGLSNQYIERPVMGVTRQIVGKGARNIGNILGKVSAEAPVGEVPSLGQATTMATKTQLPARLLTGTLATPDNQQSQAQSQQSAGTPDLSAVSALPGFVSSDQTGTAGTASNQASTPFTSDNIQRAIVADVAANGGKNVDKLISLYNTFGTSKAQSLDLTTQQKNLVSGGSNAITALNEYLNQIHQYAPDISGPLSGRVGGFLGKFGIGGKSTAAAYALESSRADVATQIAGGLSPTGRPTATLIKQVSQSLPSVTDSPQAAQYKVDQLSKRLQGVMRTEATPISQLVGNLAGQ